MKHYIGVAYQKGGHAAVTKPLDSEEECIGALKRFIQAHPGEVVRTTYMVREDEDLTSVFGKPKSRDLMQDKKFLREITATSDNRNESAQAMLDLMVGN